MMSQEYDVLILGGGLAGGCQARHLMLRIPGIRVAVVDPRTDAEIAEDRKVGESTVEIAALFLYRELGLYEYLIENHPPKHGLNFHWPKDPGRTGDMDDYYSVWTNRNPTIAAFQIHRGKLELDLMEMNRKMGATHIRGKAVDVELTAGDELHRIVVRVGDGEKTTLLAKHLVDASGRHQVVGRRTDNVVRGPENQFGLENGASWVRVRKVDKSIFLRGLDTRDSAASHYYGTNHFFGHGHWIWMIPIDMDTDELSVGVMHHHSVIPPGMVNSKEKLYAFFQSNHRLLYDLLMSGELVDFHYMGRPSHSCKRLFSPDNWYVIGDAAYIFDAFYSLGSSTIAIEVESVTEIVRAKLAGEADAETKRAAYNEFNLWLMKYVVHTYRRHAEQLGHASVMSWRIYYEYLLWYGSMVPLYVGKWHLNPSFIAQVQRYATRDLSAHIYEECTKLVARDSNLGFMDCHRADQLSGTFTTWRPFDDYLENSKYERGQVNIYRSIAKSYRYITLWYLKFRWRGFGLTGLLSPRAYLHVFRLLILSAMMWILGHKHAWAHRSQAKNRRVGEMRRQFASYRYKPMLQPLPAGASGEAMMSSDAMMEGAAGRAGAHGAKEM